MHARSHAHVVPLPIRPGELGRAPRAASPPAARCSPISIAAASSGSRDDDARPVADAALARRRERRRLPRRGPPHAAALRPRARPRPARPCQPDLAEGSCVVGDAALGPRRYPALVRRHHRELSTSTAPSSRVSPPLPAVAAPSASRYARCPLVAAASRIGSRACAPTLAALCPARHELLHRRPLLRRFPLRGHASSTPAPASPSPRTTTTTPNLLDFVLSEWATGRERTGNVHARAFPLPWISPSRFGDALDARRLPPRRATQRLRHGRRRRGPGGVRRRRQAPLLVARRVRHRLPPARATRFPSPAARQLRGRRVQRRARRPPRGHPPRQRLGRSPRPAPEPRGLARGRPLAPAHGRTAPRAAAAGATTRSTTWWGTSTSGWTRATAPSRKPTPAVRALGLRGGGDRAPPQSYLDYSTGARCSRDKLSPPCRPPREPAVIPWRPCPPPWR